jgi:hypothetical protein
MTRARVPHGPITSNLSIFNGIAIALTMINERVLDVDLVESSVHKIASAMPEPGLSFAGQQPGSFEKF